MSKDEYLITDAPLKALTVFAMPLILGSFFQQVYNMADSIIVGQFVGSSALAAVGACAALTNVFICVALGAGVGAGVLVSRYFGAKEYDKMKTIVSTSLISFLLLSICLGVIGFCFSRRMLRVLQTPADILDTASLYLRVYLRAFRFCSCTTFYPPVYLHRRIEDSAGASDFLLTLKYRDGCLDGGGTGTRRIRRSACDLNRSGHFRSVLTPSFFEPDEALSGKFSSL